MLVEQLKLTGISSYRRYLNIKQGILKMYFLTYGLHHSYYNSVLHVSELACEEMENMASKCDSSQNTCITFSCISWPGACASLADGSKMHLKGGEGQQLDALGSSPWTLPPSLGCTWNKTSLIDGLPTLSKRRTQT